MYLIQGEEDLLTPMEITAAFYNKIEAPDKDLIVVPNATHGFTPSVVAGLKKVIMKKLVPN